MFHDTMIGLSMAPNPLRRTCVFSESSLALDLLENLWGRFQLILQFWLQKYFKNQISCIIFTNCSVFIVNQRTFNNVLSVSVRSKWICTFSTLFSHLVIHLFLCRKRKTPITQKKQFAMDTFANTKNLSKKSSGFFYFEN